LTFKDNTQQFLNKISNNTTDSNLIEILLYYCYCDCLPFIVDQSINNNKSNSISAINTSNYNNNNSPTLLLDENKINEYIEFVSSYKELDNLKNLLNLYLNNSSYKLRMNNYLFEHKLSS
jgi:hypothetical protein